jgi:hypothetical protein
MLFLIYFINFKWIDIEKKAEGFQKSGLSKLIGEVLGDVVPKAREAALVIIILFAIIGTEFTSNTSMASIFIPIADAVVILKQINCMSYNILKHLILRNIKKG